MIPNPNARNRRRLPLAYHNRRLGGTAKIPRCAAIVLRLTFDSLAWIDYSQTPEPIADTQTATSPQRGA